MKKLAAGNEATTPGAASGRQLPQQEKSSQPPPDIVFNHLPLGLRDAVCSQTISTIFKQLQANTYLPRLWVRGRFCWVKPKNCGKNSRFSNFDLGLTAWAHLSFPSTGGSAVCPEKQRHYGPWGGVGVLCWGWRRSRVVLQRARRVPTSQQEIPFGLRLPRVAFRCGHEHNFLLAF